MENSKYQKMELNQNIINEICEESLEVIQNKVNKSL
jgi:hypothetical protein